MFDFGLLCTVQGNPKSDIRNPALLHYGAKESHN